MLPIQGTLLQLKISHAATKTWPSQKKKKKTNNIAIDYCYRLGFPGGAVVKNLNINVGDLRDGGLVHGLERSPVEGNGNPFQHFCLENSKDRGDWQATVHGVTRVGHNLVTKRKKEM